MVRQKVLNAISEATGLSDIRLLSPKHEGFGDYAVHEDGIQKSDVRIQDVIDKLNQSKVFEKVEKEGSFINFFVNEKILLEEAHKILEKKAAYGSVKNNSSKRINVEFGQPNTHKIPHIGHLFSYTYGESLARLLQAGGNEMYRSNYQGDIGPHVAKCLYGISHSAKAPLGTGRIQNLKTLDEKVRFLQKGYQEGAVAYKNDPKAKEDIDDINKKIYEGDKEINDLWQETRQWSRDYYKEFEAMLGTSYDQSYFESITGPIGKKTVEEHVGDIFEESDGAIIFKGEKYGLHTRVFITQNNTPTYEAKDIGLVQKKYEDWKFDQAIVTTASEQNSYWKVVEKAIELVFPELEGRLLHIGFGMVDLKEGKMSSRTGNIISAVDLIETVREKVRTSLLDDEKDPEKEQVIAIGAIKYAFLKSEAKKNITFDIDQSISLQGNSGPYLQYAYARTQSILGKSKSQSSNVKSTSNVKDTEYSILNTLYNSEELSLLRSFSRFPEVVEEAARTYSPHVVCTYVYDLAQRFSLFYEKCPILKAEDDEKQLRLVLTAATGQIIKNALYLLGIQTLDKI